MVDPLLSCDLSILRHGQEANGIRQQTQANRAGGSPLNGVPVKRFGTGSGIRNEATTIVISLGTHRLARNNPDLKRGFQSST